MTDEMIMKVELRAAKIPGVGPIAWHYWFVVEQAHHSDRWEVWQRATLKQPSWGHLHQNLLLPHSGVGNGPSFGIAQWQGTIAIALGKTLEASPQTYPYCHRYRFWPGPNSNTYVQWVLDQAAVPLRLSWKAWGKHYPGRFFRWLG